MFFTFISSGLSILSLIIIMDDKKLKDNYLKLQERKELLEKQVNELKIDELKNEIIKTKVETLRSSLEISQTNISNEMEQIKNLDNFNKEVLQPHLKNINNEGENINSTVNEIINIFNDVSNKFISNYNLIDNVKLFYNKWSDFIASLNLEQVGLVTHITTSIFIIVCLFNILSVLFSDFLIKYFELEERFPKLSKILELRRKFQNYYLIINFSLIILTLLTLIYIDFKVLMLYLL
jgi:hypothetical protein